MTAGSHPLVLANSPERNAVVALHSPKSIRTFCRSILSLDHPHFQFCSRRCTLDLYATQNAADDVTQRLPLDAIGYHSRHLCIFNTFYSDKRKQARTRHATRDNSIDATGLTLQRRDKRYLRGHYWERDSTDFDAVLRGDADATRTKLTRRYWLRRHSMQRNRTQQTRLGSYAYFGLSTSRTGEPLGDTL